MNHYRAHKFVSLTHVASAYPKDPRPVTKDLVFVGMEPKAAHAKLRDESQFARMIPLALDMDPETGEINAHPEAGSVVGPLFFRIKQQVGVDVQDFFDFSDRVVSSECKSKNRTENDGVSRGGNACAVTIARRHFFRRGAKMSLQRMRSGPCVFVTVSRNFASWVEFDCPGPDLVDRPSFADWTGRERRSATSTVRNLLSNRVAPPIGSLLQVNFSKCGHEHVLILLPNPCVPQHNKDGAMIQTEKQCVALLRELLFS